MADEAEAAQPPVKIKLLISSQADQCFDRGDIPAIKTACGAGARTGSTRRAGSPGAGSSSISSTMSATISAPSPTCARRLPTPAPGADRSRQLVTGQSGVRRGWAREIKSSGIPFLSNISLTSIFADYPNVFTTRASQDDERIPVLIQFVKQIGATRPAFIGIKDSLFSNTLADGLESGIGRRAAGGGPPARSRRREARSRRGRRRGRGPEAEEPRPRVPHRRQPPLGGDHQGIDRGRRHAASVHHRPHRVDPGRGRRRLPQRPLSGHLGGPARRLQRPAAPARSRAPPPSNGSSRARKNSRSAGMGVGRMQAAAARTTRRTCSPATTCARSGSAGSSPT